MNHLLYEKYAAIAKALGEPKRLKILEIISCGSVCACDILDHFDFTQPTLSHHINVLKKVQLVNVEQRGVWNYYSINQETANKYLQVTTHLFTHSVDCACYRIPEKENKERLSEANY